MPVKYKGVSVADRLLLSIKVDPHSGCWLWQKSIRHNGYGQVHWRGIETHAAHKLSYEVFVGPVPHGKVLDHTCHKPEACGGGKSCPHRRCINPAHLAPATNKENLARGHGPSIGRHLHCLDRIYEMRRSIARCPQGHEYSEVNTYLYRGCRCCKECAKIRDYHRQELKKKRRYGSKQTCTGS